MATTVTWTGGANGDFNVAGNWSNNAIPNANDIVVINGATVDVSQNATEDVSSLQLDATGILSIGAGNFRLHNSQTSTIDGAVLVDSALLSLGTGTIVLAGQLNVLGASAMVQTTGPTLEIKDSFSQVGTINMEGGGIGGRVATGGTGTFDTLVLQFETVVGSGVIGLGSGPGSLGDELNLINIGGAFDANIPGLELIMENHAHNEGGDYEATNGGTLVLSGFIDQTEVVSSGEPGSGLILADANSRVLFDSATVNNGTLQVDPTGTMEIGTKVTLEGSVQLIGSLSVTSGAQLVVDGLVQNPFGSSTIDAGAGHVVLHGGTLAGFDLLVGQNRLTLQGNDNFITGSTIEGSVTVAPDQRLTFGQPSGSSFIANKGTVGLTGDIDFSAVRHYATLNLLGGVAGDQVDLNGGGTIVLGGGTNNSDAGLITGGGSFDLLNEDNTIIGAGSIDNMPDLNIGAGATVEAKGGTLFLGAATIDNAGFLGAAPGATLIIGGKLNNTNSQGLHGTVIFGGPNAGISNGTLAAGSTVEIGPPGATFDSLDNEGLIQVLDNAILTIVSSLQNGGSLDLAGLLAGGAAVAQGAQPAVLTSGATMEVSGGGDTTLSGGGTITMHQGSAIESATTADTLVNVDNTIDGSGSFGGGFLNFANFATIVADDPAAPLVVNPGTLLGQNLGLMEATTGTLSVQGNVLNTDIIPGGPFPPDFSGVGTLLADGAGAVVGLDGGSVAEGLINSTNGGSVEVRGNETLLLGGFFIPSAGDQQPYARDSVLSNYANLGVLAGHTLTLAAADPALSPPAVLDNFGSISLNGTGSTGAALVIAAPTVDLTAEQVGITSGGNGTLSLGNSADQIRGATGTELLQIDETIEGVGQIGAGSLNLQNNSLIEATGTAPLVIHPASTLIQNGTLAINGDGGMVLEGTVIAAASPFRSLGGSGAFSLGGADGGADIQGGNFELGTKFLSSASVSTLDGSQNMVFNLGSILVQSGQAIAMLGLVSNSDVFINQTLQPAGRIELQPNASLSIPGQTLDLQGYGGQVVLDDASDTIDGAGATLVIDSNTISGAGHIGSGNFAFNNLSANSLVNATGALTIDTGTNTVNNAGTLQATAGGALTLTGPVDNSSAIDATGGTVTVGSDLTDSGQVNIDGGTFSAGGTVAAGQTVTFFSGFTTPEKLTLGDPAHMLGTIRFIESLDTIDLPNTVANSATINGSQLEVFDDSTMVASLSVASSAPFYNVVADGSGGSEIVVACFAAGTRIATPRGEMAVEALRIGDHVLTASGGRAPVQWIGHRHIDCHAAPRPDAVCPVRVRAGAFGDALPMRDLLLSPDHSVFAGGALIPVRYLINGRTVVQEAVAEVTYFHIELPAHGILLADGLPAESYLETGNRSAFDLVGCKSRGIAQAR